MKKLLTLFFFVLGVNIVLAQNINIESTFNPDGSFGAGNEQLICSNNQTNYNWTFNSLNISIFSVSNLANCNTIDTDANGLFSCGSDETGSVSAGSTLNVTDVNISRRLQINITSCSQALETNADGVVFCGTDLTGAGVPPTTEDFINNLSVVNDSISLLNQSGNILFPRNINNGLNINATDLDYMLAVVGGKILFNLSSSADILIESNDPAHTETTGVIRLDHKAGAIDTRVIDMEIDINSFPDTFAIVIDYNLNGLTSEEEVVGILMDVDTRFGSGGDFFGMDFQRIGTNIPVTAIRVEPELGVIHQEQGQFVNTTTAFINSSTFFQDAVANFSIRINNTEIFTNDNDYVIICNPEQFEAIEFALNTTASNPGIKPEFFHSGSGNTLIQFTPIDGTNGMRSSGLISIPSSAEDDWTVGDVNGVSNEFCIYTQRTQNSLNTIPVEDFIEIAVTTELEWNKSGDVRINDLIILGTLKEGTLALSNLLYSGQLGIKNISGGVREADAFNQGNASNFTQYRLITDFDKGNISNYTQYRLIKDFDIQNISNTTSPENMANADFTDFSCNGAGVCTLDANVCDSAEIATNAVKDDEVDYSVVTLADFANDRTDLWTLTNYTVLNKTSALFNITQDGNYVTRDNVTLKLNNISVANDNFTMGFLTFFKFNSTCGGMRSTNGGGPLLSCNNTVLV